MIFSTALRVSDERALIQAKLKQRQNHKSASAGLAADGGEDPARGVWEWGCSLRRPAAAAAVAAWREAESRAKSVQQGDHFASRAFCRTAAELRTAATWSEWCEERRRQQLRNG